METLFNSKKLQTLYVVVSQWLLPHSTYKTLSLNPGSCAVQIRRDNVLFGNLHIMRGYSNYLRVYIEFMRTREAGWKPCLFQPHTSRVTFHPLHPHRNQISARGDVWPNFA